MIVEPSTLRRDRNLYSIAPGDPFLPRLVDALFNGDLLPDFKFDHQDPMALADVIIYLPTRRAARILRAMIAERLDVKGAILPQIRPLGEFDEDSAFFDGVAPQDGLDFRPAIGNTERLLSLAPLVDAWRVSLPDFLRTRFLPREDVVLPVSKADTIWLARDLASLMDEVEIEQADWSMLSSLNQNSELAAWWSVTTQFLEIITDVWPQILNQSGQSNPAAHRSAQILREVKRLQTLKPTTPIIAAGSTGSIKATADLLGVIAGLPNGAVILPGFDHEADGALVSVLSVADEANQDATIFGHPQYGLLRLLKRIGASPDQVQVLGAVKPALEARRALISSALLPAQLTDRWASQSSPIEAIDGVTLVEASNEREEALCIAVALRDAIEQPHATAALMTPDRNLARRVASELTRFGLSAYDTGGTPLTSTQQGMFFMQLAAVSCSPKLAVPDFIAILKHPLFSMGATRAETRILVDRMEIALFRGRSGRLRFGALTGELAAAEQALLDDDRRRYLIEDTNYLVLRPKIIEFLERLDALAAPFVSTNPAPQKPLSEWTTDLVGLMEGCGQSANGDLSQLYDGDAGEALITILRDLIASGDDFIVAQTELPNVLSALLQGINVKPKFTGNTRISIWGALEGRLQTVDHLILGGLNEGIWPPSPDTGPFLSRVMKQGIGLEPPERRIGLAAHDFEMAMGMGNVTLTRTTRQGGEPQVRARWLERLIAVCSDAQNLTLAERGKVLRARAARIDYAKNQDFIARPEPKPLLELRPTQFSVTEIETLRRDAYAIYARKILRLSPLDPLVGDPGPAERGSLYHDILYERIAKKIPASDLDFRQEMAKIADAAFTRENLPEEIALLWRLRFDRMIDELIAVETAIEQNIISSHVELQSGQIAISGTSASLKGRADRIDVRDDGAAILDYKTGSTPSPKAARNLDAPQIALEAALLKRGAFAGIDKTTIADLAHIRLKADGGYIWESLKSKDCPDLDDLADQVWENLTGLILHFENIQTGYLSRGYPLTGRVYPGVYDHLARVLEWSAGASDGDETVESGFGNGSGFDE